MVVKVSQFGLHDAAGQKMCIRCGRRPQRQGRKRRQSYCKECHAQYCWERRQGKVEMLLTAAEAEAIKLARRLGQPLTADAVQGPSAGRHARG